MDASSVPGGPHAGSPSCAPALSNTGKQQLQRKNPRALSRPTTLSLDDGGLLSFGLLDKFGRSWKQLVQGISGSRKTAYQGRLLCEAYVRMGSSASTRGASRAASKPQKETLAGGDASFVQLRPGIAVGSTSGQHRSRTRSLCGSECLWRHAGSSHQSHDCDYDCHYHDM